MSNVKACKFCSTINESESGFCRICGKEFEKVPVNPETATSAQPAQQAFYQPPVVNPYVGGQMSQMPPYANPYSNAYVPNFDPKTPVIDDISSEELAAFIGPKANIYLPKFIAMEKSNKKTSFNAVVFFLSFFLTPIVGSFWFFHRKLYKMGIILLAVGVTFFVVNNFAQSPTNQALDTFMANMQSVQQNFQGNDSAYNAEVIKVFSDFLKEIAPQLIISLITMLIGLAVTITFSLFANYWYKELARKRIKEVKDANGSDLALISMAGGTKAFVWIIILVCYIIVNIAITFITSMTV